MYLANGFKDPLKMQGFVPSFAKINCSLRAKGGQNPTELAVKLYEFMIVGNRQGKLVH